MKENPFPLDVEDTLVDMLFHWFEWRQKLGSPRGVYLPEETYRWRVVNGHLLAQPGFCLAASTAPRDPGKLWEFNLAVLDLPLEQRRYVEALVVLQNEPWLRGDKWRHFFSLLNLKPRRYERLLLSALRALTRSARRRRLL